MKLKFSCSSAYSDRIYTHIFLFPSPSLCQQIKCNGGVEGMWVVVSRLNLTYFPFFTLPPTTLTHQPHPPPPPYSPPHVLLLPASVLSSDKVSCRCTDGARRLIARCRRRPGARQDGAQSPRLALLAHCFCACELRALSCERRFFGPASKQTPAEHGIQFHEKDTNFSPL